MRKFFTSDLISKLNGNNSGEILLEHSSRKGGTSKDTEYFRVWFYFDENPNVYDQTGAEKLSTESGDYTVNTTRYRLGTVNFYYAKNATEMPNTSAAPIQAVNFQQWNLWRVWNKNNDRFYDIEHEEEYLNNYASNAGYTEKQNGMEWGLDGLQLSDTVKAFAANSGGSDNRFWNWILGLIIH